MINQFSENENRYFLHSIYCYKKQTLTEYPFDENLSGKEDGIGLMIELNKDDSYYDSVTICHHHYTDNEPTWKGIG